MMNCATYRRSSGRRVRGLEPEFADNKQGNEENNLDGQEVGVRSEETREPTPLC